MQLSGSHSIFCLDAVCAEIEKRIIEQDIAPASPLFGKGQNGATQQALAIINTIAEEWQPWLQGFEAHGLELAWRANTLHVEQLTLNLDNQHLELSFVLPAGAYATTLLRELVNY